ncbi:MAG: hypothetical protein GQ542_19025 [Desulforhopalus sp.]|nr:hypothetical protein [Desulforhopalus sp.]
MKRFELSEQQEILVEDPIYTEYSLENVDEDLLKSIMRAGTIDAYCSNCESLSVFQLKGDEKHAFCNNNSIFENYGLITVNAICTRKNIYDVIEECENNFYAIFRREGDVLLKIGQHPSKADLDFGVLDESFKELPKQYRKEFGSAIGLFAHGVGIGSFVYLRRIFDKLVNEAKEAASGQPDWNEEVYNKLRMNEKIRMLDVLLPQRLVQSAHLYGFLSKGIHELDEKECKEKFPLVKQAIQLILKERHANKEFHQIIYNINR